MLDTQQVRQPRELLFCRPIKGCVCNVALLSADCDCVACMQGDDRTQSAVVLCRIMLPSSRSPRERQTFYHNLQRQVRGSSTFSDMPHHFSSDQTYPEYVIQVSEFQRESQHAVTKAETT